MDTGKGDPGQHLDSVDKEQLNPAVLLYYNLRIVNSRDTARKRDEEREDKLGRFDNGLSGATL